MAKVYVEGILSGVDFNGYVYENVFTVKAEQGDNTDSDLLKAFLDEVTGTIQPDLLACMSHQCKLLDIAGRIIYPNGSSTRHRAVNVVGDRDGDQDSGAIAGRIQWFPDSGPITGRQYITGVVNGDFTNDNITDAYKALLEDLRDDFLTWDGSDPSWEWQFVVWNKKDKSAVEITSGEVYLRCGVLGKRVRA